MVRYKKEIIKMRMVFSDELFFPSDNYAHVYKDNRWEGVTRMGRK